MQVFPSRFSFLGSDSTLAISVSRTRNSNIIQRVSIVSICKLYTRILNKLSIIFYSFFFASFSLEKNFNRFLNSLNCSTIVPCTFFTQKFKGLLFFSFFFSVHLSCHPPLNPQKLLNFSFNLSNIYDVLCFYCEFCVSLVFFSSSFFSSKFNVSRASCVPFV